MGRRSLRKGKQWELAFCRIAEEITGLSHERELTETREGNIGDVRAEGVPVAYQCKWRQRMDVFGAVREAQEAARDGEFAVAALKRSRGAPKPAELIAALPLKEWLQIKKILIDHGLWGSSDP